MSILKPRFLRYLALLIRTVCVLGASLVCQLSFAADILVFGDSLSAGYGIAQDSAWPTLLAQKFAQTSKLSVHNASISGETTAGGLSRLPAVLAAHKPRIVILELGANDGLRGLSLNTMRDNLSKMITLSKQEKAQVLVVGMRLPPNFGQDYVERFAESFAQLAKTHKTAYLPFLLTGVADAAHAKGLFQADGIHPTAAAQARILENVWQSLQPLLHTPNSKKRP